MRLCLVTDFETDWARQEWARIRATWRSSSSLEPVSDPSGADALLVTLVDCRMPYDQAIEDLKISRLWQANRDRLFVFDTSDQPKGCFPGLYASLRRAWFAKTRHRTTCYFQSFNEFIAERPRGPRPPLLFSFQGNATSPVRERLFGLSFGRTDILLERTEPFWTSIGAESTKPFKARYAEVIGDSRFVLCPRGNGTSSYRLFETMQSGRVPVIIADSWVPVENVDWSNCSVRVAEREIAALPEICAAYDAHWEEMAANARAEWTRWFSEPGLATFIAGSITSIVQRRRFAESVYTLDWPARTAAASLRRHAVTAKIALNRLRR